MERIEIPHPVRFDVKTGLVETETIVSHRLVIEFPKSVLVQEQRGQRAFHKT